MDLFPVSPEWSSCSGSLPRYRGYPCGLWSLIHTVTVISLSLPTSVQYRPTSLLISSREVLYGMVDFVRHFFSCEECRKHFTKLAVTLRRRPISYDGDAILWLWEVHNIVNERLKDESSTDPTHPKVLFPPHQVCPDCYVKTAVNNTLSSAETTSSVVLLPSWDNVGFAPGESLLQTKPVSPSVIYHWNRSAVFLFLTNFYGMGHFNEVPSHILLSAAWPRQFPVSADRHYPYKTRSSYNFVNSSLFFVQFLACLLLMAFLVSFTLRHRVLWRKTHTSFTRYKML